MKISPFLRAYFLFQMSDFETDLEPLNVMVQIEFEFKYKTFIDTQLEKYKTGILNNKNARTELIDFIKTGVVDINSYLSNTYITNLRLKYFSEEGIQLLIFYSIYNKCIDYITHTVN